LIWLVIAKSSLLAALAHSLMPDAGAYRTQKNPQSARSQASGDNPASFRAGKLRMMHRPNEYL